MSVISWASYVDSATITNSSATGSETLTKEAMKTRQLADVFRHTFTSAGTLLLDFDLGEAKVTDLIGILNHDMQGLTYTLTFGTTLGASDVGTEGPNKFWEGTSDDGPHELLYLSTAFTARYVRLSVTIPVTASPDAGRTVDVGRVWLDSAWSITVSMQFTLGISDTSTVTKTRGGSAYSSDKQVLRKLGCKAIGVTNYDLVGNASDSLLKSFLTLDLAVGVHGAVLILPLTDSQINRQRLGVYGHITDSQPISIIDKSGSDYVSEKRFTVEEDR